MGFLGKILMILRLSRNRVKCDSCGKSLYFKDLEPLQLHKCGKCQCPVFVPKKIKKYWLYRPLGAGGFGKVYKGICTSNLRTVAVKLLNCREDRAEKFVQSLRDEFKVGMALKGDAHLVRPLDFDNEGDEYFLVTEFVEGLRLDVILRNLEQIPEMIAYQLILQVLDIEQYIYDRGYLYRDLKPENIMLDRWGRIKILDYGLCLTVKDAEVHNIKRDTIEGSPYYLPPERVAGMAEDQYSEIYSLGMLFYNLLVGHTYYRSNSDVRDLVIKHIKSNKMMRMKPSLVNCNTITGLLINRMITRKPEERFNSYKVLRKALQSAYKKVRKKNKGKKQKEMTFKEFLDSSF